MMALKIASSSSLPSAIITHIPGGAVLSNPKETPGAREESRRRCRTATDTFPLTLPHALLVRFIIDLLMLMFFYRTRGTQSEEYFINERGRVIHFRSYLPQSADEIKAVVLFSHG